MLSKSSVGTVGENGVGVSEFMMLAFAEQLEVIMITIQVQQQLRNKDKKSLWTLSTQSTCQRKILWLNGDSLGMDGGKISIFE
jgi:hypothetical protein